MSEAKRTKEEDSFYMGVASRLNEVFTRLESELTPSNGKQVTQCDIYIHLYGNTKIQANSMRNKIRDMLNGKRIGLYDLTLISRKCHVSLDWLAYGDEIPPHVAQPKEMKKADKPFYDLSLHDIGAAFLCLSQICDIQISDKQENTDTAYAARITTPVTITLAPRETIMPGITSQEDNITRFSSDFEPVIKPKYGFSLSDWNSKLSSTDKITAILHAWDARGEAITDFVSNLGSLIDSRLKDFPWYEHADLLLSNLDTRSIVDGGGGLWGGEISRFRNLNANEISNFNKKMTQLEEKGYYGSDGDTSTLETEHSEIIKEPEIIKERMESITDFSNRLKKK